MKTTLEDRYIFLEIFWGFERLIPVSDREALKKSKLSGNFVRVRKLAKKYIKKLVKYRENTTLLQDSHYLGGRIISIEGFMQDPWLSRRRALTNGITLEREKLFYHYLEISNEMAKEKRLSHLLDVWGAYFKGVVVRLGTTPEQGGGFGFVFFPALVGVYLVCFFELLMDWFYTDPEDEGFEEEEWWS